jgi:putative endonuclease
MDTSRSDGAARSRHRGAWAESIASAYLTLVGLEILDSNRRAGGGEIDLIAREGNTLVFVEVRLRSARSWVGAAASIGPRKAGRIRDCARTLLRRRTDLWWPGRTCRFDVVALRLRGGGLDLTHLRAVELPRARPPWRR